jgi:hypothetical protein
MPPPCTLPQAQTFCPQFNHRQVLPLVLSPAMLGALAQKTAEVSLWHHCPRSQAVAAALAQGQPSGRLMAGQQQVLLGAGSVPLAPLLLRPQVGVLGQVVPRVSVDKEAAVAVKQLVSLLYVFSLMEPSTSANTVLVYLVDSQVLVSPRCTHSSGCCHGRR